MNSQKLFWMFTTIFFCGLLLPFLLQFAMFLDGVSYAAIGNNLANDIGTFWQPHYTKTYGSEFYRHPPLAFGIQSLFYQFFGDGLFVERVYSFLMAVFTAFGIVLTWRLFHQDLSLKKMSWLPVILWISVPLIFWSYSNNILENTMSVFTIFSIYFISKALLDQKALWLLLGSLFIVLAFLTKGFVGLFPLAAPLLFGIAFRHQLRLSLGYNFLLVVAVISLVMLLFFLVPDSRVNTLAYIQDQLMPALENADTTTSNRFAILPELLLELSLPLILVLFFYFRKKIKKQEIVLPNKQEAIYFLLLGLAASLPIIISLKQRKFYMMPSVTYYVLAASFLICNELDALLSWFNEKRKKWFFRINIGLSFLVLLICFASFGHYSKDADKWHDVKVIASYVESGETISTTKSMWGDWGLHAYLARMNQISIDCDHQLKYYIVEKGDETLTALLQDYQVLDLDLQKYELLEQR